MCGDDIGEFKDWVFKPEDLDAFWKKHYDDLRKSGIAKSVALNALIGCDREESAKIAYR
jgi:hypothetical protein